MEPTVKEVYKEIRQLRKEVAELKSILLDTEGELSEYAKERLKKYLSSPSKGKSQQDIEHEFL
jgi:hypothetical protein